MIDELRLDLEDFYIADKGLPPHLNHARNIVDDLRQMVLDGRQALRGKGGPVKALIIIDMLKDFVDGALTNPKAQAIIGPTQELLQHARDEGWVIVFSNDAHSPEDPELKVWGPHAMFGTPGAEVIDALAPRDNEIVSPKRTYGAFDFNDLDAVLKRLHVEEVVLAGQHTHICVRHTAYGALIRGFDITVVRDAVCAFGDVDEEAALNYLLTVYGARIVTLEGLRMMEPA